jgi:EAL domain-containing protein (putative c-di-GMP-specific phosphodiesterase class I)
MIKLDRTLIAGIETDRARQALAAGLISFAGHLGASIVAEGDRIQQLTALRTLGVAQGEGYFLARPLPPRSPLDPEALRDIEHRLEHALSTAL